MARKPTCAVSRMARTIFGSVEFFTAAMRGGEMKTMSGNWLFVRKSASGFFIFYERQGDGTAMAA